MTGKASILALLLLAASCGGGGGGGGGGGAGGGGGSNSPGLTVSTTSLQVTADAGIPGGPTASFTITVSNPPASGVSIGGSFSQNGISNVTLDPTSATTGTVTVFFRDPSVLGPGVFDDTIQIAICTDSSCSAVVSGTLRTVNVRYTVTGTPPPRPTVTASRILVQVLAAPYNLASLEETVTLTVQGIAIENVYVQTSHTNDSLNYVSTLRNATGGYDVQMNFRSSAVLGFGTFVDTVTITLCTTTLCQTQLDGSPVVINTELTVSETVPGPNGYTIRPVAASANDVMWDSVSGNIYFTSPASAAANPNSVVALDPVSGQLVASAFAGSDPTFGAVSDDGQFLYAGFQGSNTIRRFRLPGLAQDILIPLGNYPSGPLFAGQILAFPGQPNTIAVSRSASPGFPGGYDAAVFDDDVQRPNAFHPDFAHIASIQFGATPDVLYGGDGMITTMSIDANGVNFVSSADFRTNLGPARIYFDSGLIYTDRGQVIDPVAGILVGNFGLDGPGGEFGMAAVPDSTLNRIFFLVSTGFTYVIRSYDMTTFTLIAEIRLGGVDFPINRPLRMIRWGPDGLAVPTGEGTILLISGPFVRP